MDLVYERRVRQLAMTWLDILDPSHAQLFRREALRGFSVDGQSVALMNEQGGIMKPRQLEAALSMRTAYTRPGQKPPYADEPGREGLQRYMYRGTDPQAPANRAIRQAYEAGLPLIWFVGVAPALYLPIYPVWVVGEESRELRFVLAFEEQLFVPIGQELSEDRRAWVERVTKARLHQARFRAQVLHAYRYRCAMCRLAVPTLLDAAHILPDVHPRGLPVVPNGLSLCKIHHAAFDQNLVGIRPDLVVAVRRDIAAIQDGPMLEHGLKELQGAMITVPPQAGLTPDRGRLEERWAEFLASAPPGA